MNRKKILFVSDRRWMAWNDRLYLWMKEFVEKHDDANAFLNEVVRDGVIDTKKVLEITGEWAEWGRFTGFLFIETLCIICALKATEIQIPWAIGDTATSGLFNLFGMDGSANYFDKNNKLPPEITIADCDRMFDKVVSIIKRAGGDTNTSKIETSLCAYRKFYKGTRYNGFYLDRQLQELYYYEKMPGCGRMVKTLFELRKRHFSFKYLGEIGGWQGIRKPCKTLYKRAGKMM